MSRPAAALVSGAALLLAAGPASAAFLIQVNYSGEARFRPAFDDAASTWQSLLSDYQDGVAVARTAGSSYAVGEQIGTLFIDATLAPNDGPGGVLGFAGPTEAVLDRLDYVLSTDGEMTFDSADADGLLSAGIFGAVVLHEMAHVMGFGTLWTSNGVYVNGTGEFLGPNATAAWNTEYGQPGTPDVELDFGPGTANGHWNEDPTVLDTAGRPLTRELMTGFLDAPTYISRMTVGSFVDIGFVAAPVPEPLAATGVVAVLAPVVLRRRRRIE